MSTSQGFYSRFVGWLKILLPLVALGILSTVFFLARAPEVDPVLPYATPSGAPITASDMIADPSFVGVTRDGAAVNLRARSVQPTAEDVPGRLLADRLTSRVETRDGRSIDSRADSGRIDTEAQTADLDGRVDVATSDGFTLVARDVKTRLDRVEIASTEPVSAQTPMGTLEAGGFSVTSDEGDGYVLVFNGGVKLIYAPQTDGGR
ncbi:MAG: hypothetical protein HKO95_05985 [Rhodobacteraceae bacterium]|nr:hypothetical protein [Paracoccaceae bacterium]